MVSAKRSYKKIIEIVDMDSVNEEAVWRSFAQ